MSADRKLFWDKCVIALTGFATLFMAFRIPFLAMGAGAFLSIWPSLKRFIPSSRFAIVCVFLICVTSLFLVRMPWDFENTRRINDLTKLIERHVPPDRTILTLPYGSEIASYVIPTRATYLGWHESNYVMYSPSLVDHYWERAKLLGILPIVDHIECRNWLFKPLCRRQVFQNMARDRNNIWRHNLGRIRQIVPTLSHILLPQSMLCRNDQVAGRSHKLALVDIDGVALSTCEH